MLCQQACWCVLTFWKCTKQVIWNLPRWGNNVKWPPTLPCGLATSTYLFSHHLSSAPPTCWHGQFLWWIIHAALNCLCERLKPPGKSTISAGLQLCFFCWNLGSRLLVKPHSVLQQPLATCPRHPPPFRSATPRFLWCLGSLGARSRFATRLKNLTSAKNTCYPFTCLARCLVTLRPPKHPVTFVPASLVVLFVFSTMWDGMECTLAPISFV